MNQQINIINSTQNTTPSDINVHLVSHSDTWKCCFSEQLVHKFVTTHYPHRKHNLFTATAGFSMNITDADNI